jgi:hypothetical protein
MRNAAALRRFEPETEAGRPRPYASARRHPQLYLASLRREDGRVLTFDSVGRVDKIIGPYEQSQSVATLDFDYAPVQTPTSDAGGATVPLTAVPWALTQHVDKDATGCGAQKFHPRST